MEIRLADVRNEKEQILVGVRDFVSRMDFAEFLPDDKEWFEAYVIELLSSPNIEVIVAEHDERIVAGIGMAYSPLLWNPGVLQAEELFWWAAQDAPQTAAIRVLHAARARAAGKDEKTFVAFKALTSSPESVRRIYTKMGLREVETSYIGAV